MLSRIYVKFPQETHLSEESVEIKCQVEGRFFLSKKKILY